VKKNFKSFGNRAYLRVGAAHEPPKKRLSWPLVAVALLYLLVMVSMAKASSLQPVSVRTADPSATVHLYGYAVRDGDFL
jgi:hypothetical protein